MYSVSVKRWTNACMHNMYACGTHVHNEANVHKFKLRSYLMQRCVSGQLVLSAKWVVRTLHQVRNF